MRNYRVILASTKAGLIAAAGDWIVLSSTIREFANLESHDDQSLGDIGSVLVEQPGFVCLAYKDA